MATAAAFAGALAQRPSAAPDWSDVERALGRTGAAQPGPGAEVNPVLRALPSGGVAVTALHGHMLDESPRLCFMHYWANDDATALARTLRAALDRTNSAIR